jgi:hypothetical protein
MIRRPLKHRFPRRIHDPSMMSHGTDAVATVSTTGTTNVTIDLSIPIALNGLCGITVDGAPVLSSTQVTPTQITCVAAGAVTGLDWVILTRDPSMRTNTGGYVVAATGTF